MTSIQLNWIRLLVVPMCANHRGHKLYRKHTYIFGWNCRQSWRQRQRKRWWWFFFSILNIHCIDNADIIFVLIIMIIVVHNFNDIFHEHAKTSTTNLNGKTLTEYKLVVFRKSGTSNSVIRLSSSFLFSFFWTFFIHSNDDKTKKIYSC